MPQIDWIAVSSDPSDTSEKAPIGKCPIIQPKDKARKAQRRGRKTERHHRWRIQVENCYGREQYSGGNPKTKAANTTESFRPKLFKISNAHTRKKTSHAQMRGTVDFIPRASSSHSVYSENQTDNEE